MARIAVLVDRVDVIEIELGLRHDAAEIWKKAPHHAGLVHHPKDLFGIAPVGEDRAEGAVGLRVVAHRCGDQPVALVDQAERCRMNVAALGLRPAKDRHEAHRALAEGAFADRRDAPARDEEPVASGPDLRPRSVDRRGVETLRLQHRAEYPRELADRLRDEEIVLHEPLDGQIAAARPIAHARRDLGLAVEGEAILRAGADDVQVRPHPPEEILRPREATILVPAEHSTLDELAETLDAEEVLGDPEQHVEIAQTRPCRPLRWLRGDSANRPRAGGGRRVREAWRRQTRPRCRAPTRQENAGGTHRRAPDRPTHGAIRARRSGSSCPPAPLRRQSETERVAWPTARPRSHIM